jgi:hypothetical protein
VPSVLVPLFLGRLYWASKADPGRRFHTPFDKVTLAEAEEHGGGRLLDELPATQAK